MLESNTYKDSLANGELVPQITLNPLADPNDEWTFLEVGQIMYKQLYQWLNWDLEHSGVSTYIFGNFQVAFCTCQYDFL